MKIKASFTIEASVVVPLTILLMAGCINTGFDFLTEVKVAAQDTADLREIHPVDMVRAHQVVDDIWEGLK